MALAKSIIAQIRRLERALNQALLRLQDTSDVEALHDVRINLQRIRSLLRPLRGIPRRNWPQQRCCRLGKNHYADTRSGSADRRTGTTPVGMAGQYAQNRAAPPQTRADVTAVADPLSHSATYLAKNPSAELNPDTSNVVLPSACASR
jgi:hypothetical protein